jgi:membrane-bound lytic murein transglycosylase B
MTKFGRIPWCLSMGLLCSLLLAVPVLAMTTHDKQGPEPFERWLEGFLQEAREQGITEQTLNRAFAGVNVNQKVLALDNQQSSGTVSLQGYINGKVNKYRIDKGRKMMTQHRDALARVERRYDVQSRFIVAFWGIETNFGGYTGNHDVIRSLATLAYHPRRGDYFRQELLAALNILQEGHIERDKFLGSWAGAVGQSQFMPTNFIRFAQDFDQDGKKDIWRSEPDVFASIANYLRENGWSNDHTWGRKVLVPKALRSNFETLLPDPAQPGCRALTRHTAPRSLRDWQTMGVRADNNSSLPARDLNASLIIPESGGPGYLVYDNFKGILKYNCSNYYALSVAKLSDHYQ